MRFIKASVSVFFKLRCCMKYRKYPHYMSSKIGITEGLYGIVCNERPGYVFKVPVLFPSFKQAEEFARDSNRYRPGTFANEFFGYEAIAKPPYLKIYNIPTRDGSAWCIALKEHLDQLPQKHCTIYDNYENAQYDLFNLREWPKEFSL